MSDNLNGFRLFHSAETPSTNDQAKEFARANPSMQAVFLADQQIGGRGRSGNSWISPVGNLYMSVLLPCNINIRHAGQYSFLAAVATHRALSTKIGPQDTLKLKWPNDLLLNDRKLSGILLETAADGTQLKNLIIGIGVNILHAPEYAASLPVKTTPMEAAGMILDEIVRLDRDFQAFGFEPIRQEWLSYSKGLGQVIQVRLPQQTLQGAFAGLDENGCLILEQDNKTLTIASGDVFFE